MSAHADDTAESFIAAWRESWPEWRIAEVFLPPAERPLAAAWLALLATWTAAAQTAEPAPGLAKLAWWQEELHGWSRGARRHPLGRLLQKQPVDWATLARKLPGLMRQDAGIDTAALSGLATALAEAEAALFADATVHGTAESLAGLQLALGLAAETAAGQGAGRVRRLMNALLRARARQPRVPLSPWTTLRCSWQAARRGGTP